MLIDLVNHYYLSGTLTKNFLKITSFNTIFQKTFELYFPSFPTPLDSRLHLSFVNFEFSFKPYNICFPYSTRQTANGIMCSTTYPISFLFCMREKKVLSNTHDSRVLVLVCER